MNEAPDIKRTTISDIISGSFLQINESARPESSSTIMPLKDFNIEDGLSTITTEATDTITINIVDEEIEQAAIDIVHSFTLDIGVSDTNIKQVQTSDSKTDVTTELPAITSVGGQDITNTNRSSGSRAVENARPRANIIPTESPNVKDITNTFEITFAAKGDEETKGKNNTKSTKKLLVSPSIQEFNNTAIFLEKDPACQ